MTLHQGSSVQFFGPRASRVLFRGRKFFQLENEQRRLVLAAAARLFVARLLLLRMRSRRVQRLLVRKARRCNDLTVEKASSFARAVERASVVVPGATCLPRALVLQAMLARQGHDSKIHVGFVRHCNGLRGHAWLEWEGRVLIGGGDLTGFRTQLTLTAGAKE